MYGYNISKFREDYFPNSFYFTLDFILDFPKQLTQFPSQVEGDQT